MSTELSPIDRIRAIVKKDGRYRVEGYCYVFEALDYTLRRLGEHRHVTGRELCEGVRDLAIEKFGPLATTVFRHWGITRTEDFGTIVFRLVDAGLMGKTDTDSPDDFRAVYDFEEVFERNLRLDVSIDGR
jgi:uncharacterized repeat protein (TIGR04138 family)